MTRTLYSLLLWLLLPVFAVAGWRRCRRAERLGVRLPKCFLQRWGLVPHDWQQGGIWLHAVSVGESRSVFPLLQALRDRYPDLPITVTNGSAQGAFQIQRHSPVPVQNGLIPYDYPFAMRRFLTQLRPELVVIVETELWPNLYAECKRLNIPLLIINARLKTKSWRAYQRWGQPLVRHTLRIPDLIGTQFPVDAERFRQLGAPPERIRVLGNLKSDLTLPENLTQQAAALAPALQGRFVWCAASTHAGEEEQVLKAHGQLLKQQPDALLILAPRHADRFDAVAEILRQQQFSFCRRSQNRIPDADTQVWLLDTMGELLLFYALSDVAFVGGTLVPFGGHNVLEPAALKKPVLSGPHYGNLQALYEAMLDCGGIHIVSDESRLVDQLCTLAQDDQQRTRLGEQAHRCFTRLQGALPRTLDAILPHLPEETAAAHSSPAGNQQ